MKSLYDAYNTDKSAESGEGVILDYGEAGRIRIHRAGGSNQRYKNYLQARMKPYTRQMQTGTMDEEVARSIMVDVYANTVIVGWDGVRDQKGREMEYNVENVRKVLNDLPDLFDDIQRAAQDISLFRADVQEDVAGN